jgi:hypothetical protein
MGSDGKQICNYYSAIFPFNKKESFTLIIKNSEKDNFMHGLDQLNAGDTANFQGPMGCLTYQD